MNKFLERLNEYFKDNPDGDFWVVFWAWAEQEDFYSSRVVEQVRKGKPIPVEDYEQCVENGFGEDLNEAKKEYKRSKKYKDSVKARGHRVGYKPKIK